MARNSGCWRLTVRKDHAQVLWTRPFGLVDRQAFGVWPAHAAMPFRRSAWRVGAATEPCVCGRCPVVTQPDRTPRRGANGRRRAACVSDPWSESKSSSPTAMRPRSMFTGMLIVLLQKARPNERCSNVRKRVRHEYFPTLDDPGGKTGKCSFGMSAPDEFVQTPYPALKARRKRRRHVSH